MIEGKLKFWNAERGFGFLTREDGSGDVFVHFSHMRAAGVEVPMENQKFRFDVIDNPRNGKSMAANIEVTDG